MARRRLLTILAASAVLGAAVTGPAAAADLTGTTQDPVSEVTAETVEADAGAVAADAVEATTQAVEDAVEAVAPEPVADVADEVAEAVAPEPSPSPAPTTDDSGPAADGSDDDERVVAAGDVTAAPSLAFLTGTGGSAPAPQPRFDPKLPSMPIVSSEPRTDEGVAAPQVAPAAAADTSAPSALTESVQRAVDEEGAPIMVLVAIASLLAAGVGTVRGTRAATIA